MVDIAKQCPEGMVLIAAGGVRYPEEPGFCLEVTETTQEADNKFWAEIQKSRFELVITKKGGSQRVIQWPEDLPWPPPRPKSGDEWRRLLEKLSLDSRKLLLHSSEQSQEEAFKRLASGIIREPDVSEVRVQPPGGIKPQPTGNFLGPRKPAILRTWQEARDSCAGRYRGGDLPTVAQWEKACGGKKYCTASGQLRPTEARYGEEREAGPVDVGSYRAGANGVYDMTGNVEEWTRDDYGGGCKFLRGGSFMFDAGLLAFAYGDGKMRYTAWLYDRKETLGFRCVAPPLSEIGESIWDK